MGEQRTGSLCHSGLTGVPPDSSIQSNRSPGVTLYHVVLLHFLHVTQSDPTSSRLRILIRLPCPCPLHSVGPVRAQAWLLYLASANQGPRATSVLLPVFAWPTSSQCFLHFEIIEKNSNESQHATCGNGVTVTSQCPGVNLPRRTATPECSRIVGGGDGARRQETLGPTCRA